MKYAATDAAKAVQMLDLLGEFFADGCRWIRGEFHDDEGNRCLVGAMRHIRAVRNFYGDPTRYYLQKAMAEDEEGLVAFNDGCRDFEELRGLMLKARRLAVADIAAQPGLAIRPLGGIAAARPPPISPASFSLRPAAGR